MAQPSVNKELVIDRLSRIREYVKQLKELGKLSLQEFISDYRNIGSAERLLQIAIEACLDIGSHIVSRYGHERPREYKDIFLILGKERAIPYEFSERLIPMVRFRNRLVHLYWEIDKEELYNIIQNNLRDIEEFVQHIIIFLEKEKV